MFLVKNDKNRYECFDDRTLSCSIGATRCR